MFPGDENQISVSIGVAGATLGMSGFEVLLKRADEALYLAKGGGRNQVTVAPKQLGEKYQILSKAMESPAQAAKL